MCLAHLSAGDERKTGLFTGTRTIARNVKRSYFGVILQGAGINEGRGVLIEPTTLSPVMIAP